MQGLAGAYTAVAEGVDGTAVNAAGPAVREPFSFEWFDWDLDLGVSFPGSYADTDFDNRGQAAKGKFDRVNNFIYFNFGAQAQLGYFGTSFTGEFLRYDVAPATSDRPSLTLVSGRWHLLTAYGMAHDQFVVGAGLRAVSMQLSASGGGITSGTVLTMTGVAPEVGVLAKPDDIPFRLGVTLRAPVEGRPFGKSGAVTDPTGVTRVGTLILPRSVVLPWELEAGFALQVGPRPLNPSWIDPHAQEGRVRNRIADERERREHQIERTLAATPPADRRAKEVELAIEEEAIRAIEKERLETESRVLYWQRRARYDNWPREKILLVGSILVTGASDNSVALEGFLDQRQERFGRVASISPRIGIEAEPILNLVKARVGSYLEPSRFDVGTARQHFTTGGDLKLWPWDPFGIIGDQVWRVSFALDLAPRYVDWGLAIGAWH